MPASKYLPVEIRFGVSEDMHRWLKFSAMDKGQTIGAFLRSLTDEAMRKSERKQFHRRTDPLIEEMAEKMNLVEAIAEKLGVEMPEKPMNSEVENKAPKE